MCSGPDCLETDDEQLLLQWCTVRRTEREVSVTAVDLDRRSHDPDVTEDQAWIPIHSLRAPNQRYLGLVVQLRRSVMHEKPKVRGTIRALFRPNARVGDVVVRDDHPGTLGMLRTVAHLVRVRPLVDRAWEHELRPPVERLEDTRDEAVLTVVREEQVGDLPSSVLSYETFAFTVTAAPDCVAMEWMTETDARTSLAFLGQVLDTSPGYLAARARNDGRIALTSLNRTERSKENASSRMRERVYQRANSKSFEDLIGEVITSAAPSEMWRVDVRHLGVVFHARKSLVEGDTASVLGLITDRVDRRLLTAIVEGTIAPEALPAVPSLLTELEKAASMSARAR
jgi:ribosomal protein L30/L7E